MEIDEIKETLEKVQKGQEGQVTAWKAVAETLDKMSDVLEKMNTALSKQEEDEKEDEDERMVDELAEKVKAKMAATQISKEDSKESSAKLKTKPEAQQDIIQGSANSDVSKADEDEWEDEDEEEGEVRRPPRDVDENAQVKALKSSLDKAVAEAMRSVDVKGIVEKAIDEKLSKMGVGEARSVKRVSIPVNPDSQNLSLKKSAKREDIVEELSKMSWSQLSRLEEAVNNGEVTLE